MATHLDVVGCVTASYTMTDARLKFAPRFVISTVYVAVLSKPEAMYFGTSNWVHSARGLYWIELSVTEDVAPGVSLYTATVKRPCAQSSLPRSMKATVSFRVNVSVAPYVDVARHG